MGTVRGLEFEPGFEGPLLALELIGGVLVPMFLFASARVRATRDSRVGATINCSINSSMTGFLIPA